MASDQLMSSFVPSNTRSVELSRALARPADFGAAPHLLFPAPNREANDYDNAT